MSAVTSFFSLLKRACHAAAEEETRCSVKKEAGPGASAGLRISFHAQRSYGMCGFRDVGFVFVLLFSATVLSTV